MLLTVLCTIRLQYSSWLYSIVSISIRSMLVFLSLALVIAVPSFSLLVSLLGSLGSFTICVTFPCACYLKLFWKEIGLGTKVINILFIMIGISGSVIGTWACLTGHGGPD